MKKSILALTAISFLASNFAFAHGNHQGNHPKHNPEFHQAMSECMAQAGIEKPKFDKDTKPELKKDGQAKNERTPNTDRPEPPKDAQGRPMRPQHGKHPKLEMTDAQRSQVDACLAKKGFEKPQKPQKTS
ncbi:hypothetical protein [Moraxella oblonga]|uniref:hypothetical protein n=1 Tax=Moraxella oblonga TaxID=200413 RepID=UPI00083488B8|nr:hypothetical protein [Moraxella oblonga]